MPRIPFALIIAIALWTAAPARAQPLEVRPRDRARTFLVMRLAEALDLSEEKTLELSRIIRGIDDRRRELRRQREDVEDRLRAALGRSPREAAALTKLVADANEIDQQLAMLPEKSFREAQKILTPDQQARLILLRPQLQNEIGQLRRRFLGGEGERPRWRRGPGGDD